MKKKKNDNIVSLMGYEFRSLSDNQNISTMIKIKNLNKPNAAYTGGKPKNYHEIVLT